MNETIIKVDRRGRLRYAAEHKQALIEAYQASGLSGPKFAELHGVPYQTLISWLKKRRTVSAGHPVLASLVPLRGQSSHGNICNFVRLVFLVLSAKNTKIDLIIR